MGIASISVDTIERAMVDLPQSAPTFVHLKRSVIMQRMACHPLRPDSR
jgi:hypothetical protein